MSLARQLASSMSATPVTGTNALNSRGPAGVGAASAGVLLLSTAEETVVDADQLFATGDSGAATEKLRIDSTGDIIATGKIMVRRGSAFQTTTHASWILA